jgi:hypothetical protein
MGGNRRVGREIIAIEHDLQPDVVAEALGVIREHFDGPIGVYAESGDWAAASGQNTSECWPTAWRG